MCALCLDVSVVVYVYMCAAYFRTIVMGDTAIITAHKYAKTQQLVTSLTEMRRAEVLCDVTLAVDDVTVPCHKLILAASSPYFKCV